MVPKPSRPLLRTSRQAAATATLCASLALASFGQQQMSAPPAQPSPSPLQGQPIVSRPADPLPPQQASVQNPTPANNSPSLLTPDARVLLVLDRFTYGPRPGDLDRARAMGLSAWFQQQLNPAAIDDSALEERLAGYPAINLPLDKLFAEFPTNDAVQAGMNGRGPSALGADAAGRAVYKHREEAYDKRKERKKEKAQDSAPGMSEAPPVPLPETPENILALAPPARFKLLCKLDGPQLRELRRQLGSNRDRLTDGFTPAQIEALAAFDGPTEVIANEDVQAKLLRDIYSERQLQEVMTDFWLNHFNVFLRKNQQAPYFLTQYVRDVIRPHALGHFENLLLATAQSPAMLQYLDQSESIGPHSQAAAEQRFNGQRKAAGLNENYAREVMELHTIGVDGGYTQHDVIELAKVFTGWTVLEGYRNSLPTRAIYDARKHEPGNKVVLNHVVKERGVEEGFEVLRMLAESPQCARFISRKLAVHFVSDDPPRPMLDRMTATFLETHGDIRRVLLAMVNSPEFFTTSTFRAKVKTPQEFVVSAIRATGADVEDPQALARTVANLGMPLFGHQTPDGYSMRSDAWSSTTALVSRMNFSMALATDRVQGVHTDLAKLLGPGSDIFTARQKQDQIEALLLHTRVSARTEQLIAKETTAPPDQQRAQLSQVTAVYGGGRFFNPDKGRPARMPLTGRPSNDLSSLDLPAALATGLVLGSPEFQRR